MIEKLNMLFVGVGGQGILTASDIAAQVGLDLGLTRKSLRSTGSHSAGRRGKPRSLARSVGPRHAERAPWTF